VALLVTSYTEAGDLIANPSGDPTITAVAEWLDRRTTRYLTQRHHHPSTDRPRRGTHRAVEPAALVLDMSPGPRHVGLDPNRLAGWIRRRRDALRPGGFLLVAIRADRETGVFTDRATPLITAARTAGLIYHQHLVAVHTPLPEPDPDPGRDNPPGRLVDGRHGRVHSDLYAFTSGDVDE
jgi:hypothetical protein